MGLISYLEPARQSLVQLVHELEHHTATDSDDPRVVMATEEINEAVKHLNRISWIIEEIDKSEKSASA